VPSGQLSYDEYTDHTLSIPMAVLGLAYGGVAFLFFFLTEAPCRSTNSGTLCLTSTNFCLVTDEDDSNADCYIGETNRSFVRGRLSVSPIGRVFDLKFFILAMSEYVFV